MPSPIHMRTECRGSRPASVQDKLNGKGDAGPGKQERDGRANTNAGATEVKAQPWFVTEPGGSIKKWIGGQ